MADPTVHFIYPHGGSIACPHAIGTKLGSRLAQHYRVRHYDLTHARPIVPAPGDLLLGHPDASFWTVFRSSVRDPRWARRIMIAPFTHGDYRQCAYIDRIIGRCDLFLAITGRYWMEGVPSSRFAHWGPKLVHLDLAVDPADFPPLKKAFAPTGQRRFVYIGHAGWYKNLPYLSRLAQRLPHRSFHWIGDPSQRLEGVVPQGRQDFRTRAGQDLVASYDFLITVGTADPNPTTILEAMAWGLIPVCSRQSGYHDEPGIINIPIDDCDGAAAILEGLQDMPETTLEAMQARNRQRLGEHYHWERFAQVVLDALRSDRSPALLPRSLRTRLFLLAQEARAPQFGLRFQHFRRAILRRFGGRVSTHDCAVGTACATSPPGPG